MVQIIRNTNPKHFETILTGLQRKGWHLDGKIVITKVKGRQSFEAKMVHGKRREIV